MRAVFPIAILTWVLFSPINLVFAADAPSTLSPEVVKRVLPLLEKHDMIGIARHDPQGRFTGMTLLTRISASRETVFNLFRNPDNFYFISSLFKENTILDQHDNTMVWSWASRHKIISVVGRNRIDLYPPRRADVTVLDSSVGQGRFVLQFFKGSEKTTILAINGRLDVDSSEWLIRFLVGNNPAMRQAMNMAIGFVVIKGAKTLATAIERGRPPRKHRASGPGGGPFVPLSRAEVLRLAPLLAQGQVVVCDSTPAGRLRQAIVVDQIAASLRTVQGAVRTPENYGRYVGAIGNIVTKARGDGFVAFSWRVGLSIFGLASTNRLSWPTAETVVLEALDGEMKGASWMWKLYPSQNRHTVVAYHAFVDVAAASAILGTTVRREPYLEHGLVLGSNIVLMGAMKRAVIGDQQSTIEK